MAPSSAPSTLVFHYAQEIFEGRKAYRLPGGGALFRPDANARRFQRSARCLAMPALPEELFLASVRELVKLDRGGMNVFFVFDDGTLQTPPITGTILPGITRDSLITLARDLGLTVREEPYAIDQWQADQN